MTELTYATPGPWGAGKGAPLTPEEADADLYNLESRVEAMETDPPEAVGISNIIVNEAGTQITIVLSDATEFGPIDLPRPKLKWRAEWTATTGYFENDFFRNSNSLYFVLADHISAADFDAGAEDTDGALYEQIIGPLDLTFSTIVTVGTTTRQVDSTEAGSYFRCIHVDGCEVIVPTNAVAPFQIGDEFHVYQGSSNTVLFTANPGVLFNPVDGFLFETAGRGQVVSFKYIGSNTWDVFGGLLEDVTA
jgi:hypothetical protein